MLLIAPHTCILLPLQNIYMYATLKVPLHIYTLKTAQCHIKENRHLKLVPFPLHDIFTQVLGNLKKKNSTSVSERDHEV